MSSSTARDVKLGTSINAAAAQEISLSIHGMTCGSCVRHVQAALKAVSGVETAEVSLTAGAATVRYDPSKATVEALREAVAVAGYGADEISSSSGMTVPRHDAAAGARTIPRLPVAVGLAAAMALAGVYLGIIAVAQSWEHAIELFTSDWYFVVAIAAGFGAQVGLFTYLRTIVLTPGRTGSAIAVTGAGTGTSTVSMLACCAHHLTDILPLLGLSGAAIFLTDYRVPSMILGIAGNVVGIAIMLRLIHKVRRGACCA